jgi:hypothetical protein
MENLVAAAVKSVNEAKTAFCKFISANDTGTTGSHQSGYYMPKSSIKLMFDDPGIKGEYKERAITI